MINSITDKEDIMCMDLGLNLFNKEEQIMNEDLPKITDYDTNEEFFDVCDMAKFDIVNQMIIPLQAEAMLQEFKNFLVGDGKLNKEG